MIYQQRYLAIAKDCRVSLYIIYAYAEWSEYGILFFIVFYVYYARIIHLYSILRYKTM